jgi:general nucleoside transport system permease protein
MNVVTELILTPDFLFTVIRVTTPILFAALGALISEKAGIVNIGLEGIMLLAALIGVLASSWAASAVVGLLFAVLSGIAVSWILGYFTLHMKTDIILGGIAVNLFAEGGTVFLLFVTTRDKGTSSSLASKVLPEVQIPLIERIPMLGEVLSGHNILTYIALAAVFGMYYMLKHTPFGIWVRAVGENPEAAESVGIDVKKVKMRALLLSGICASLGGAFLSMGYVSWFSRNMSAGRGWIALAAEAMGNGIVGKTVIASFLFGGADALANTLQMLKIPSELLKTLPYLSTLIGLGLYAYRSTKKRNYRSRPND